MFPKEHFIKALRKTLIRHYLIVGKEKSVSLVHAVEVKLSTYVVISDTT